MYSSYNRAPRGTERPKPRPEKPEPAQGAAEKPEPEQGASDKPAQKGLLEALLEDKEQSLLMLLLVILMKDGADLNLILALLYLVI